ncbi:MAG TPA: hypothetical protein ENJ95_06880 [Bacteroidetes bacterium]|nr:hypothetical protein [Bacteroidota bacterium]
MQGNKRWERSYIILHHFPAVNSSKVKDLYNQSGRSSYFKRISFNLDIYKLYPWKMVDVDRFGF